MRPSPAVFREEQTFGWWMYALLALMALIGVVFAFVVGHRGAGLHGRPGWGEVPVSLAVGIVLPSVLVVGVLRMTTEVIPSECRVWFGWVPTYRRAIAIETIQRVEVIQYRPLVDCGGWGVRMSRNGDRVLNARGNRGVRLHLIDGTRLIIGSQRPEELAATLEQAIRPAA
jgi:hypothetical protein